MTEETEIALKKEINVSSLGIAEHFLGEKDIIDFEEAEGNETSRFWIDGYSIKFFTGEKEFESLNKKLYLVRALYYYGQEGGYSVYYENGNLLVIHYAMGHEVPESMNRSALVVCLPSKPKAIYVMCRIVE